MQVMTGSVDGDEQKAQEEAGKVRFVLLTDTGEKVQKLARVFSTRC